MSARGPVPDIPGFAILQRLGEGGMGSVWPAEQRAGPRVRQVALKLLERADTAGLQRFRRELELQAADSAPICPPCLERLHRVALEQPGGIRR